MNNYSTNPDDYKDLDKPARQAIIQNFNYMNSTFSSVNNIYQHAIDLFTDKINSIDPSFTDIIEIYQDNVDFLKQKIIMNQKKAGKLATINLGHINELLK